MEKSRNQNKTRNLTKAQWSEGIRTLIINERYVNFANKSINSSIYSYIFHTNNCKSTDVISNTSYCNSVDVINNACFDIYKIVTISESGYTQDQEKKINQDNYFGISVDKERYFIGVCDGHGQKGHVVSKYVVNYIEDNSTALFNEQTDITNEIKSLMENTQQSLIQNKTNIIKQSGTTLTSALILKDKMYLVNVGDSKTMLVYNDKRTISTSLHSLENEEERKFIDLSKAEVSRLKDESGEETGPLRLFQKGKPGPGLMMSRSLGDSIGHDLGMSVEPEVIEIKCKGNEKYLIIASDGLWDKVQDDDVCEIVDKYYESIDDNVDLNECCQKLLEIAENNWRAEEDVVDDITIIIVFFNKRNF